MVTRRKAGWGKIDLPLTNGVVAVAGKMACIDTSTGLITKGGTSTTLLPFGLFLEDKTGTGTNLVSIEPFAYIPLVEWANDGSSPAADANRGSMCYIKDDSTVSMSSAGSTRSVAGMVLDVRSTGVLVLSGVTVAGATGASGDPATFETDVDLMSGVLAAGTVLAAFADGDSVTPGINVANSEAMGVRWNDHATPAAVFKSIPLPADLDATQDLTIEILASKTGATDADDVTFTIGAFLNTVGALHDADANFGGATDAMVGTATAKTVQRVTLTLPAAALTADATALTLSVKPTDGTLETDDVILISCKVIGKRTLA
jgi:hypothetical protein